jgi:hypothetical protein
MERKASVRKWNTTWLEWTFCLLKCLTSFSSFFPTDITRKKEIIIIIIIIIIISDHALQRLTELFIFPYWYQSPEKWKINKNSNLALQRLNTTQIGAYFKNTLLLRPLTDTYNNINRDQFSQKAGHMLLKEHGSTVGGRLLALLL